MYGQAEIWQNGVAYGSDTITPVMCQRVKVIDKQPSAVSVIFNAAADPTDHFHGLRASCINVTEEESK